MRKPTGRPAGRPAYKPTPTQREDVELLVLQGVGHREIASIVGIARETLEKYFEPELTLGRIKKRHEAVKHLMRLGKAGNATALKKIVDLADSSPARSAQPVEPRPPKLGKKEQAQVDATTAGDGTDWGDDLRTPIDRMN